MKIVEITSASFPSAQELPCKSGRPVSKHQKSPGGNSGSGKKSGRRTPELTGKIRLEAQIADRKTTEANQMILWLINGKRKFVRAAVYEKLRTELGESATIGKGMR